MKKILKKLTSVFLSCVIAVSAVAATSLTASAAVYHYPEYTTLTNIATRSGCYAMEAFAVGSVYLYTVKVDLNTEKTAIISKTNKNTGAVTNLSSSSGATTFSYLGHANSMDVATVNDKSNLYISTMKAAADNLVRMEVDGSKINKKGAFTVRLNGSPVSIPGMAITSNTSTTINFLFQKGTHFYKGSIPKTATSGNIDITLAFKINTKEVMINGAMKDLSKFCYQDFGYHNGKIFVAMSGHTAGVPNESVAIVYDVSNASGTITSVPNLSFFITSSAYPEKCEIEGCDISPSDGKLYFNTNRIKNGNGNDYDGVHVFKDYVYSESIFPVQANLGDSFYAKIGNVNANKDVSADLSNTDDNVIIYDKSDKSDHIWKFDRYSDGSYKITNTYNGKCLDVTGSTSAKGTNIALYNDNGKTSQKWYIYKHNGNYILKAACSAYYLDISGGSKENFANVQTWTFNDTAAQQFTIDYVNVEETTQPTTDSTTQPTTEVATQATTSAVQYFPACDSSYTTLSTALDSIGVDSSKAYRTIIAEANGITDYTGTAEQNTQMLNLLKAGKLIKPADTESTEATVPTESTTASETTEPTEVVETTTTNPSDYILGDVNRDGNISILDATEIQKIIAALIESYDEVNILADVNSDNRVNIKDATLIQMYCVGIVDSFNGTGNSEVTEPTTEPETEPTIEPTAEPATTEPETEPTTEAVTYFPACDSSYTTISTALASIGVDNSFAYRKEIAAVNGIENFTGTAEQNTQMLNLLKQGKLIKP